MFDGVPWAVGNGSDTAPSAARAAHYAGTSGGQGVSLPGDFKVTATATPSQSVQIAPGSMTLLNQQAAGESYQGLARSVTDVDISVTGSARTDLVIARIIDPDFSPWQPSDVPDAVNGPYFEPFVIEGVDPGTTKASDVVSYSAYELARIAIPASGNIDNGIITDLRALCLPHKDETKLVSSAPAAVEAISAVGSFARWITPASFSVFIPEWATHYLARLDVTNSIHVGPDGFGVLGLFLGGSLVASNPWAALGAAGTSSRVSVQSAITNGPQALPGGYAGSTRTFDLRAYKDSGSADGYLESDAQTRAILEVTWLQQAV